MVNRRLRPARAPGLSRGLGSSSRALSDGADKILATSLHNTGEGRAGKGQKSKRVHHFENWKFSQVLNLEESNE